ncbi:phage tail tip lysozyme [Burkholderia sp. PAMC 28687]|uniref:phage tail tip lysozyme n=1 Tax=Burkholderia sp. PAMC 28687 TaxID=1795874 RepID=UPI000A9E2055|nr:phage tail tip lysozyme [Burkholderia sp. PAMC 28687]
MATVIDALVVTLGLDPAQYKRGQADAKKSIKATSDEAAHAAKEMEARGQQAALFFTKIRNEALALLAVFTAGMGLKNFTEHTILSTAALGRMSENLGMSAKDLAEWQLAAKNAGGTAEGITAALLDSQKEVAKFKLTGVTEGINKFLQYGGKASDLKDGNTYLLARARIISNLAKTDPGRAQLVASQMGITPAEFNFLKQGPEAIEAARRAQAGLATALGNASKPAEELRRNFDSLENQLQVTGVTLLTALMPEIKQLVAWLEKLADWIVDHKEDIVKWVDDTVKKIQKNAPLVKAWVDSVIKDFERIAPVAERIFTVIGNIMGVFLRLAGLDPIDWEAKLGDPKAAKGPTPAEKTTSWIDDKVSSATAWVHSKTDGDGQKRAKAALAYFQSQGWTREQAAGIVGSVTQESNVDPNAENKTSGAFGIGQWLGDRVKAFKAWSGHDLKGSTFDEQLGFMQYELTHGIYKRAGDHIKAAKTFAEAAAIHSNEYEIPGKSEAMIPQRQAYAAQLLKDTEGKSVIDPKIVAVPKSDVDPKIVEVPSDARRYAARAATQYPIGARAIAPSMTDNSSVSHSSTETHVNGPVNIYTQATDAKGIASAFGSEVKKFNFTVSQENNGLG